MTAADRLCRADKIDHDISYPRGHSGHKKRNKSHHLDTRTGGNEDKSCGSHLKQIFENYGRDRQVSLEI